MEEALKRLQQKLDDYLDKALAEKWDQAKNEANKMDRIKVPMPMFANFLRYNLLVKSSSNEKKQIWERFLAGLQSKQGEIPLMVMYDGFTIYTDTMAAVQETNIKTIKYYKQSQIATVAV